MAGLLAESRSCSDGLSSKALYKDYNDLLLRDDDQLIIDDAQDSYGLYEQINQYKTSGTFPLRLYNAALHLFITYVNQISTKISYEAFDEYFQRLTDIAPKVLHGERKYNLEALIQV